MEIIKKGDKCIVFGIIKDIIPGSGTKKNTITTIVLDDCRDLTRNQKKTIYLKCENSSCGSTTSDRARRLKRGDIIAAKVSLIDKDKYRCYDLKKSGLFFITEEWEVSKECVVLGKVIEVVTDTTSISVTVAINNSHGSTLYRLGFFNSAYEKAQTIQSGDIICARATDIYHCFFGKDDFFEGHGNYYEISKGRSEIDGNENSLRAQQQMYAQLPQAIWN